VLSRAFNWVKGFWRRRTLELTGREIGRIRQMPGELQLPEALWWEYKKTVGFNTIAERVKCHNTWHASWIACTEYHRSRR
jgi:hypothetical protein